MPSPDCADACLSTLTFLPRDDPAWGSIRTSVVSGDETLITVEGSEVMSYTCLEPGTCYELVFEFLDPDLELSDQTSLVVETPSDVAGGVCFLDARRGKHTPDARRGVAS